MMIVRRAALVAAFLVAGQTARAAGADAAAPISALNTSLIASMHAGELSFPQRFATLAPVVERAFDLPAVLQTVVGPRWASLPGDQQASLLEVFRKFTTANYAANFKSFSGERIDLLPETRTVGEDQVVETQIVPAKGEPTRIDYVMRRGENGWRAVDVLLAGSISQDAVQRSDFRSLLSNGGAGPLIESLTRKVAELSGGTL